jgi:hypothetical protein
MLRSQTLKIVINFPFELEISRPMTSLCNKNKHRVKRKGASRAGIRYLLQDGRAREAGAEMMHESLKVCPECY